jgi:4-diphosphocytidyl-2-C-methyl-D-erythritol kinase
VGKAVSRLAGRLSVLYRCYAKVNLTLEILRRRADGYHDLASLVHTVSLSDGLRIDPSDSILTRTSGLEIESDANLVTRAAQRLATASRTPRGAELSLDKGIPAAAGLGGGSSDAATTLVGLNELWGADLPQHELSNLAADLGADVPYFLRGGAALMEGRGECLTSLPPLQDQWLVLLVPRHALQHKTARLYAALAPSDFSQGEATRYAATRLLRGQALEDDHLLNGFARAARSVFAGLDEVWSEAERVAQRRFFLSGAGPALFALADSGAAAGGLAQQLQHLGEPTFAVHTVQHARTSTTH